VTATYAELERRIAALPGVEAAGFTYDVPLASDHQGTTVLIEGDAPPPQGEEPRTHFTIASPGYFGAMGIPLVSGRAFRAEDTADAPAAVIVNQTFVRLYLAGRDPLGMRLLGFSDPLSIVGVAGDVRLETLTDEPTPTIYLPHAQSAGTRSMSLVVRAQRDPAALVTAVRDEIRAVARTVPVFDIRTMAQVQGETMAQPRFSAFMLLAFSGAALLLAGIGLYGLIAFIVSLQTRAIGIRMALGARPTDELKRIVAGGLRLLAAGVAIGLAGAIAAGRVLRALLFEVQPLDPVTLAATTSFLVLVGLLACVGPAWRASRMDPVRALRHE
jgi:predicted permease